MNESQLLSLAFFIYLIGGGIYAVAFFKNSRKVGQWGFGFAVAAFLFHSGALWVRTKMSGHAPFSNLYESLVFYSWCFILSYLFAEKAWKVFRLGFFAVFFNTALLVYTFSHDASMKPLMPALQSNWMLLHVISCFLAYGAFGISFLASLIYLTPLKKSFLPEQLDQVMYKSILFGFPLLTLGVGSGAIWANEAWGVYWSWDPKETWALITWFVYALYLHLRLMKGWTGQRLVWVALGGFLCVIFTYLGVSYLMSGLHSYA